MAAHWGRWNDMVDTPSANKWSERLKVLPLPLASNIYIHWGRLLEAV